MNDLLLEIPPLGTTDKTLIDLYSQAEELAQKWNSLAEAIRQRRLEMQRQFEASDPILQSTLAKMAAWDNGTSPHQAELAREREAKAAGTAAPESPYAKQRRLELEGRRLAAEAVLGRKLT